MRFCNDCGERHGHCKCKECADCGKLASDLCFECESHFCDECLHKRPGYEHLRWCAECLEKLAQYVPCANPDPAGTCAGKTFAPELLHDCMDCGKTLCPSCIVKTPLPGFYALYHCPDGDAERKRRTAA